MVPTLVNKALRYFIKLYHLRQDLPDNLKRARPKSMDSDLEALVLINKTTTHVDLMSKLHEL